MFCCRCWGYKHRLLSKSSIRTQIDEVSASSFYFALNSKISTLILLFLSCLVKYRKSIIESYKGDRYDM